MNEARNAIDLIIHAPEKVAEGYLSSLLASKAIQQFEKRHLELREEAAPSEEPALPAEVDQKMAEIELAMAQKNLELLDTQGDYMRPKGELFLKTFNFLDKIVTIKKVGSGVSAPVVVYVDDGKGPQKLDTFMTAPQAERESKKILKLQAQQAEKLAKEEEKKMAEMEKQQAEMEDENNEVQEASIDALRQSSLDGILLEHEDGSQSYMTFQETQDVLEIHKRLNNTNRDKFEKTFASSQDAATQMVNFFQERLRKDVI
jgi:thioesterase domain-containing protein